MNQNYKEMFEAIDSCYVRALQIPCLVLIYTTIDSISWLAYGGSEKSTKVRFSRWAEYYLIPRLGEAMSSLDLYAARCSILHGLSWESGLSKSGQAKALIYAMGKDTESAAKHSKAFFSEQVVCVHVDTLISALKEAVNNFFADAEEDQALSERINDAIGKTYAKVPIADYKKLMKEVERMKASNKQNQTDA